MVTQHVNLIYVVLMLMAIDDIIPNHKKSCFYII